MLSWYSSAGGSTICCSLFHIRPALSLFFFAQSLLSVAGTAALTQWVSFRAVATLVRIMKARGPSAASSLSSLARPSPISWLMTSVPVCISDALPQSGSQPGEGIIRLLSLNTTSLVINMLATPVRERPVQAAAASPTPPRIFFSDAAHLCSSAIFIYILYYNILSVRHAGCGCPQDIGAKTSDLNKSWTCASVPCTSA